MRKLNGTVIPIITPMTEDDRIDEDSLRNVVNHCIGHGLQCLYPCGTTGEMMYLTTEERKRVAEITVQETAHRVPVFVHVGSWNQEITIELAKHAVKIGADGIGVVTPTFYKISDEAMVRFYCAVSEAVPKDFPVYLYAIPQNAVNDISVETADRIAQQCPNVVGIKYSYADFSKIQNFTCLREGTFSVLAGPDQFYEALCVAGGDGVVSGTAMCIPEQYSAIWAAICARDWEKATKLQRRIIELNRIFFEVDNIAAYKAVFKAEGIIRSDYMRKPLQPLTEEQTKTLFSKLNREQYHQVIV
jgi:4-hydroxy-tetrahydrodipicolinate synthase